jgi:hypothetical protein
MCARARRAPRMAPNQVRDRRSGLSGRCRTDNPALPKSPQSIYPPRCSTSQRRPLRTSKCRAGKRAYILLVLCCSPSPAGDQGGLSPALAGTRQTLRCKMTSHLPNVIRKSCGQRIQSTEPNSCKLACCLWLKSDFLLDSGCLRKKSKACGEDVTNLHPSRRIRGRRTRQHVEISVAVSILVARARRACCRLCFKKAREGSQSIIRHVMLNAFRIEFGAVARHTDGNKEIDNETMARTHPRREALTQRR